MNTAMKGFAVFALCTSMAAALAGEAPVRIVPEGGLVTNWVVKPGTELAAPGYPEAFASRGDDVCVAMGYRVQPDGTTSDVVMLRGWNSSKREIEPLPGYWDGYAQAGAAALAHWRFAPRTGVVAESPVDTVAVMTFRGKGSTRAATLASNCAVPDGVARMQFARNEESGRGHSSLRAVEASQYHASQSHASRDAAEARQAASAYARQR